MSLGAHLIELRNRLFIAAIAVAAAMAAGWYLTPWVWSMLHKPLDDLAATGREVAIQYTDVSSGFDTKVQIAFFFAMLVSSPVWLYQIWAFIVPGLTRREKWHAVGFLGAAVPLFFAGVYVGWSVLPNIVRLMASFQPPEDVFFMNARTYLDFTTKLMLAVGVGFVLPVLLVLLNFLGVLRGMTILKQWRIAIIAIITFAAITTPATELMSMFVLAAPIVVLYFIAAGVAIWHDRIVDKKRAVEFAEYGLDEVEHPEGSA